MPLQGSPVGIAEAIDLPDNHAYVKASPNLLRNNRKVEPEITARVEDEPQLVARVEEPRVIARVEELPPITAHAEGHRKLDASKSFSGVQANRGYIDTSRPFESVKEVVSKYGGILDWKAHRAQKRSKSLGLELETSDEIAKLRLQYNLPEDLESTNKLIEELKQNLERAQKEEHKAIQASEAARIKAEELEQEIANESLHAAALSDLNSVSEKLEGLHDEYACLAIQKDIAVKIAEEAVAASEKIEQSLKDLTLSLTDADKDCCSWKLELQHVEEKLKRLHQQALAMRDLKSKLEASSSLLLDLKSELAAYMESKSKQEGEELRKVLEEVKINIEKTAAELDSVITTIGKSEETVSSAVVSLKAELETKSQIASLEIKNKAALESAYAKSLAKAAEIVLCEAKEEAEQSKAKASALKISLDEAQKELEDAKNYEKVAIEAVKVLQEFKADENNYGMDFPPEVTLTLKEYYDFRKRVHEVNQELAARRQSLKMATEKAEKAEEGKLGVEQELQKLKAHKTEGKKKKQNKKKALFSRFACCFSFSKKKSHHSK